MPWTSYQVGVRSGRLSEAAYLAKLKSLGCDVIVSEGLDHLGIDAIVDGHRIQVKESLGALIAKHHVDSYLAKLQHNKVDFLVVLEEYELGDPVLEGIASDASIDWLWDHTVSPSWLIRYLTRTKARKSAG